MFAFWWFEHNDPPEGRKANQTLGKCKTFALGAGAADGENYNVEDEGVALTKGRMDDWYATISKKMLGLAQQGDSSANSALKTCGMILLWSSRNFLSVLDTSNDIDNCFWEVREASRWTGDHQQLFSKICQICALNDAPSATFV